MILINIKLFKEMIIVLYMKKQKDKFRTICTKLKFNEFDYNILDFATHISKNIYNIQIFATKIFYKFKYTILNELIDVIIKKNLKDKQSIDMHLFLLYDKYYNLYSTLNPIIINNNNIIFKYIVDYLDGILLCNDNFYDIKNDLIFKLNTNEDIIKSEYANITFYNVINDILKYFYNKNYNIVFEHITEHKPLNNFYFNQKFIDQIKNGNNLFKDDSNDDIKNKIEELSGIDITSDQNITTRFTLKHLDNNYKYLGSDLKKNIVTHAFNCYKSYFALRNKGIKANMPKFLPKDGKFNIYFHNRLFKIDKDCKYININLGKYIGENYINISKNNEIFLKKKTKIASFYEKINKKYNIFKRNESHIINGNILKVKIPKPIKYKNICQVEIKPINNKYEISFKYEYEIPIENKTKPTKMMAKDSISIDIGMKNLMAIYDPNGDSYLIKGNYIVGLNKRYNHAIDKHKSKLRNNQKSSKRIRNMYYNRFKKINEYFNKLVKWIHEEYQNKKQIIIGYNEYWKQNVNMGKENNRKFVDIPYQQLIKKLENKFGKRIIITEESYTSKCDSLALECLCKHEKYKGKRIKRGLYSSSVRKLLNADINGAINIMRKQITLKRITGQIYNPIKVCIEGLKLKPRCNYGENGITIKL